MNKLLIVSEGFSSLIDNPAICIECGKITFVKDTEMEIDITEMEETLEFVLEKNIRVTLYVTGMNTQNSVVYHIKENSYLSVQKLVFENHDRVDIFLDEKGASVTYCYSEVSRKNSNYQISVVHGAKQTKSYLFNHGVSLDHAAIQFEVNGTVTKDSPEAICNQENQILHFIDSSSTILPKLYIDHFDVDATHSAYIGDFNEQDLFYLMSRGIPLSESRRLLMKSFLLGKMSLEGERLSNYIEMIEKY